MKRRVDILEFLQWAGWAMLIAGTPLMVCAQCFDSYFLLKQQFIKWMAVAMTSLAVVRAAWGRDVVLPLRPAVWATILFAVWEGASVMWAESRSLAVERAVMWAALLVLFLLFLDFTGGRRRRLLAVGWLFVASALATALWTLWQDFVRGFFPQRLGVMSRLEDWRGYLAAGLGNTNHIGDLLALGVLAGLGPWLTMRKRGRRGWPALAALAAGQTVLLAGLVVVWSVGSNLGLILGGGLFIMLCAKALGRVARRRAARRLAVLAVAGAGAAAFFVVPHPLNPHPSGLLAEALSSERWKAGGPTRLVIWHTTMEIVRGHPVLGVGTGNFTYAYPQTPAPAVLEDDSLAPYAGLWTNAAHNMFLQTWAETGLVGLGLLVGVVFLFYRRVGRGLFGAAPVDFLVRAGLLALMTAFIGHALMNFQLETPCGALVFVLLLAAGIGYQEPAGCGGAARDLIVPVSLRMAGGLCLTAWLRNVKTPVRLAVQFDWGRTGRWAAAGGAALMVLLAAQLSSRAVVADCLYRVARQAAAINQPQAVDEFIQAALRVNPNHHDARSFYSAWLLRQGRWQEALVQLERVRQRLSALEVDARMGVALYHLGDRDAARRLWNHYLTLRPLNLPADISPEHQAEIFQQIAAP
ncbi:MAG: hypothetical protein Kow0059_01570 [Candidatus Sumerlaeia bacterium]